MKFIMVSLRNQAADNFSRLLRFLSFNFYAETEQTLFSDFSSQLLLIGWEAAKK